MFGGLFGTTMELAELRNRLTRLELKMDAMLEHLEVDWTSKLSEVDHQILDLLRQGDKLQAVKLYRNKTGATLVDAKAHVERLG